MKNLIATIILYLLQLPISQADTLTRQLVADVKIARQNDRSARLDVSSIVRRHILSSFPLEKTLATLKEDGFKCTLHVVHQVDSTLTIYACEADLRRWYNFGFGDKLRLYIQVNDAAIEGASGELFYQAI